MKKVIIIHGNGGSTGRDNWFPYIKNELENLGVECLTPDFPDSELARAKYWLPFLKNELKADKDTILVGHSSGAVAAMRYAEENKILGSILVGTYHSHLDEESEKQSGYFDKPWDWKTIIENQQWVVIFASEDDPYIPIEHPDYISEMLGAEYHRVKGEGHFGSDKNKTTFPELLEVLKQKLGLAK